MNTQPDHVADDFRVPLDMEKVAADAAKSKTYFKLSYICHGEEFRWEGAAVSKGLADLMARAALVDFYPNFNRYKAQLVSSIEEVIA